MVSCHHLYQEKRNARKNMWGWQKRRQVREHMGMKEKERDDVGFTRAGATSSCLYFSSSTDYLAQLTPLLCPSTHQALLPCPPPTPTHCRPGAIRGGTQSHCQSHIRSEYFPGKSELPWKSEFSSPENSGIYGIKGPQIQGVWRRRLFGSWSAKLQSAFNIFRCCWKKSVNILGF